MKFSTSVGTAISGEPIYDRAEYSFRFENLQHTESTQERLTGERTSIAIGTLQLAVQADTGIALFVWGYLPWFRWTRGAVNPSSCKAAVVVAHVDGGFMPGIARRLAAVGEWTTVFDEQTGYVRITCDPSRSDDETVLIATRTYLGLVGDELHSISVKPDFINDPP